MKKTERLYVELDLASIVGAKENLRDTAPSLSQRGYGIFQPTEKQPHSLASLALSDDAQQQAEYVSLIEQNEPTVKELADNMVTNGQLEPIRVRPTEEKEKYDLVFGARRVLARLYIHARSAGKVPARLTAEVVEQDAKDALYASISENIRVEPSPMDDARNYERLRKLCWNLQVEPVPYLSRLEGFCRRHGFDAEKGWYEKATAALPGSKD